VRKENGERASVGEKREKVWYVACGLCRFSQMGLVAVSDDGHHSGPLALKKARKERRSSKDTNGE